MEALASAWEQGLVARFPEAAHDAKLLAVDRETVALQLPQAMEAIQVSQLLRSQGGGWAPAA